MKNKSLSKRILDRLKELNCWVHKGSICKRAEEWGYLAETAGRRCREMASGKLSNGKTCPIVLEEMKNDKGHVMYRYKPQQKILTRWIKDYKTNTAYPVQETIII